VDCFASLAMTAYCGAEPVRDTMRRASLRGGVWPLMRKTAELGADGDDQHHAAA